MGMSTHVVGFKPIDETFRNMKKVWFACQAAGVEPPEAVERFFGNVIKPDFSVVIEVDLDNILREWGNDSCSGYEVTVDDIPVDVKVIRFYNSW